MITLYNQQSQNTYSNYNWNANNDNYAWSFVATTSGIPDRMELYLQGIVGTPTGEIYIKGDKTIASTTYGSATGITFTAGTNIISITGGAMMTAGNTYWVYFRRTSNASNYPQFQQYGTSPTLPIWRSSSSNIDPNTLWQTADVKMKIDGIFISEVLNPEILLNFLT